MLIYNQSLALLTDLYQLTMAYGYWKSGIGQKEATFHLFFRKNPFNGGYCVAAGLAHVITLLQHFKFDASDVDYLASLTGRDGNPLFEDKFLQYLQEMSFSCDLDAVPEGTIVFPSEPLIRIQGDIIQTQILETALLNIINFQSLIATKAARVCMAAEGEPVLEFGVRRAQGIDGGLAASRAAYIGGCAATSNVLAGKVYGIPVKGTHAHSWVMCFDDELEAFQTYAKAMPNNCVFLVDTYDTLEGVKKAIEVGKWLRSEGHEMIGIRLDSGDLAYLSIEARKLLDEAGFPHATIVASNDLDETIINSLKQQGAQIGMWGVGTKLITAYDQPALGGVYKLSCIRDRDGEWHHRVKLSEQAIKISNPGIQQVRRYFHNGESVADVIYDVSTDLSSGCVMVDPMDMTRQKRLTAGTPFEDLLVPVFRNGSCVYQNPPIAEIRAQTHQNLEKFHSGVKRFVNPHQYPVGLEKSLHTLKTDLVLKARGVKS
ncbi:MAG TPA: nicotinate phosphoribosyltransferase [Acidobacteriota bacterium]|nr:nicotinate phosphoribosyltransferase [Acidobacteriota bacterium]HNB71186.1 nicotinate phosphoribosyltransferase [Acidobacteriota bacterium]HNG92913.1 nicotinate phosphoribosyltransferase [Acidobacteriota bacterium]HNJ43285.1 nicotinate phosphoribosyltransferase [Acidobacteriota bacterium]